MGRKCTLIIIFGLASPLLACGAVDSQLSYVPAVFRQPSPKLVEIEQRPNAHLLVRNNIPTIFMAAAMPSNVSVSLPVRAQNGGWTICLRAATNGVTGKPLGLQTYLVSIDHDQIGQRERLDGADLRCAKETYEPIDAAAGPLSTPSQ
jgi:hypothetical protein